MWTIRAITGGWWCPYIPPDGPSPVSDVLRYNHCVAIHCVKSTREKSPGNGVFFFVHYFSISDNKIQAKIVYNHCLILYNNLYYRYG